MKSGTIILTSDGLTHPQMAEEVVKAAGKNLQDKKVAIVTTASKNKEKNIYSMRACSQYDEMGFHSIEFVDLEATPDFDFGPYHVFHVCGGNTFKLLHFCRLANFKKSIEELLARDGVYVGVSAGSLILLPTIDMVEEYNLDPNLIGMKDFTGFDMVPMYIYVHYFPTCEMAASSYEKRHFVKVERLANNQAVLISHDIHKKIGD